MLKLKHISVWILAVFLFASCTKEVESTPGQPFYYCQKEYQYGSESSAIATENYSPDASMSPEQIISKYLTGPQSEGLSSPFPAGTTLQYLKIGTDHTEIVLSPEFATLEKIDLTIACACLTLTISDLTNCTTVEISASDSLLNNQKSIIMDVNALSLADIITARPDQ